MVKCMYVWTDLGKPDGVCVCLCVLFFLHITVKRRNDVEKVKFGYVTVTRCIQNVISNKLAGGD